MAGGADGIVGPHTWSHTFSHVQFFVQVPGFDYYRYDALDGRAAPSALRWDYGKTQWEAFVPVSGGWRRIGSNHPDRTFTPCGSSERSGRNKRIVFVHGIDSDASGTSCDGTWRDMMSSLRAWGWTRVFYPIEYYDADTLGGTSSTGTVVNEVIDSHGNHTAYGASGHLNGSHTADAKIEHLAYHFAWFIYHAFSSRGIFVDVAAHSMGGPDHALCHPRRPERLASFPPNILIEDVVTFGTPHGGAVFCRQLQLGRV